ncbi:MAG: hypothetical protein ACK4IY_01465 [Chitinophagales bacterium]
MKKLTRFIFIPALVLVIASCSDQKQLEKNLTRQAGRWNIDNYKVTIATTDQPTEVLEYGDSGYMYFFDNGDGQWIDLKDPDETLFVEFEWEITEESKLLIEYNNEDFIFDFVVNEKDRQVIRNEEVVQLSETVFVTTTIEYELLRIE